MWWQKWGCKSDVINRTRSFEYFTAKNTDAAWKFCKSAADVLDIFNSWILLYKSLERRFITLGFQIGYLKNQESLSKERSFLHLFDVFRFRFTL